MKEYNILKNILQLISEEMGYVNSRAGRGYGTSHPQLVKSRRMMLGPVNNVDDLMSSEEEEGPVKISKVFLRSSKEA